MFVSKAFIQKAIVVLGGNVAVVASTFIVAAIIVSTKSVEAFGLYSVLLAIYMIAGAFKPLTWQAFVKYYPKSIPGQLLKKSSLVDVYGFLFSFVASSMILIFEYAGLWIFELSATVVSVLVFVSSFNNLGTVLGYLRSTNRFTHIAFIQGILSISKIGISYLVFIQGYYDLDVEGFIVICCLIDSVVWVFALIVILVSETKARDPLGENLVGFEKFSYQGTATALVDVPVAHLDYLIVSSILGLEAAGVFGLIKRISKVFGQVADPIYQVLFPEFSKCVAVGSLQQIRYMVWKVSLYVLLVCAIGVSGFALSYDLIDVMLFSGELRDYKSIVLFYMLAQVLAICFVWVHPLLISFGNLYLNFKITLVANLMYLIGILMALKWIGFSGVVLAIFIQYSISVGFKLAYVVPLINERRLLVSK